MHNSSYFLKVDENEKINIKLKVYHDLRAMIIGNVSI